MSDIPQLEKKISKIHFEDAFLNSMPDLKKIKSHMMTKKNIDAIDEERLLLIQQNEEDFQTSSSARKVADTQLPPGMMAEYMKKRAEMIEEVQPNEFDKDIVLSQKEEQVAIKLEKLKTEILHEDPECITGNFYDKKEFLEKSKVFEALNEMPKPAIHHLHLTAAVPMKYLVKLTYRDYVYYNQHMNIIKVTKNKMEEEGFVKCNQLRQYWKSPQEFDAYLEKEILLGPEQIQTGETHAIWMNFQHKFTLTLQLLNYYEFFEYFLHKILHSFIEQHVMIIEFRHIFNCVIDDDGNPIGVKAELDIIEKVVKTLQQQYPLLKVTIINCALKIIGKAHVQAMLDATLEAQEYSDMVVGFDMVNEEDEYGSVSEFVPQILESRAKSGKGLDVFLHAGESLERTNNNLVDSVLLGTKRIGHGYNLIQHPELIETVKEKEICLECCPVSNKVLGQVLDVRCHPVRTLMQMGVPCTINSDDPGFWGYEGVTLDYVYVFLAWDLSLGELKKLCLNTVKYSSIPENQKQEHYEAFEERWKRFLNFVRGRY